MNKLRDIKNKYLPSREYKNKKYIDHLDEMFNKTDKLVALSKQLLNPDHTKVIKYNEIRREANELANDIQKNYPEYVTKDHHNLIDMLATDINTSFGLIKRYKNIKRRSSKKRGSKRRGFKKRGSKRHGSKRRCSKY